jgi:hypothetical protein
LVEERGTINLNLMALALYRRIAGKTHAGKALHIMLSDISPGIRGFGDDLMEQKIQAAAALGKQPPVESCQGGIFVPVQENGETWPPCEALEMGTAFPCLYSPWEKGEDCYG